jgi:hypothetical protein
VLPRSIAPRFIANLAYRQNSCLSWFPPLKIPCYTGKLSYRHPPQVFRHKSRKTTLNSPVSTAHNYLLTAVYWSVIMECQNGSSDTVIDLIVECRNRWSVVLIWIITCIYFSGVIGRSHLIVKLSAICCYVNFGFSFGGFAWLLRVGTGDQLFWLE